MTLSSSPSRGGESKRELQVGVKVLLKNPEGRYLLLKRNPKKYPEMPTQDLWDIVGGRINTGIPLIENLKREVKEETSLDLIDEPKLIAAQDILRVSTKHVVRLTYTASIEGEPKLDSDHTEFGWFTLEEMKELENLDIYFTELLNNNILSS